MPVACAGPVPASNEEVVRVACASDSERRERQGAMEGRRQPAPCSGLSWSAGSVVPDICGCRNARGLSAFRHQYASVK